MVKVQNKVCGFCEKPRAICVAIGKHGFVEHHEGPGDEKNAYDLKELWGRLERYNSELGVFQIRRKPGDEKPHRLVILVDGEGDCQTVWDALFQAGIFEDEWPGEA